MHVSGDDPVCPKFQPNIFDPSRCHDCLRQRHLHMGPGGGTEETARPKPTADAWPGAKKGAWQGNKGGPLMPIPSPGEDRDTSSMDDSDRLSLVSSYCNVLGGSPRLEESSLCILSPDCELYICDSDGDSTDGCANPRDDREFSGSVSSEEEYSPIRCHPLKRRMTRLDPPRHRPNPRAWMDDARSRDTFSRRSEFKECRDKRESGHHFSSVRSFHENAVLSPFRHFERGHPIYSSANVEPKDTVPFRNPNLGVASERQIPEDRNEDLPEEILPPDPFDMAVEVEAQIGPRSPSPTPFKIAESLASTGPKGLSGSHGSSFHAAPFGQSRPIEASRQGSPRQSRCSSPSRGNSTFRSSNLTASPGWQNFGRTRGMDPGSRESLHGKHVRHNEPKTLTRNFRSFADSVKSQSSAISDFRSTLRKTTMSDSLSGSRRASPAGRECTAPGTISLRKADVSSSLSHGGLSGRSSSPSTRPSGVHLDRRRSSPPTRNQSSFSRSSLRQSESLVSLNGQTHHGRCGSPIREGYDIESQALLRNATTRNGLNNQEDENPIVTRPNYSTPSQANRRETRPAAVGSSRGLEGRSASPTSRNYETSNRYLRKTCASGSLSGCGPKSRPSSPLRRTNEAPTQSPLHKSEARSWVGGGEGHGSLSSRKNYTDNCSPRRTELSGSLSRKNPSSRNSSPSGKATRDPPGYSILKHATSGDLSCSLQRKNTWNESKSDPSHSQSQNHSRHGTSLSHAGPACRKTAHGSRSASVTMEMPRSPGRTRSRERRHGVEDRCTSPYDRGTSRQIRGSPPPPHQILTQRHTSSQSSLDSSESGQLSASRNGEEYATLADPPKVKSTQKREGPEHDGHQKDQRQLRKQELFKPASHSLSKHPSRDWEEAGEAERGWTCSSSGFLSRVQSPLPLQRSANPMADEGTSWRRNPHRSESMQEQPDLLNFKKGWMSKLDESGEWKKHWFVLSDAGLKYYRDSSAEEKDDLDGEIDLKSCVNVSEFDVEKNYGFQIQTREAVFTLSAMTAGIRRNWIEVLKKCIRPSSSPDLTQLPDSSSDKENSSSRFLLSSRRSSQRHANAQPDVPASIPKTQRRFEYVELSPVPASSRPLPVNQREAGEGQGREHSPWQEDRTRNTSSSQWDALLSRKGTGIGTNQRPHMEEEIEKKWAEFERMPLKEMSSLPTTGSRLSSHSANEALQREVASLRQKLEQLQHESGEGGGGGGGVRGRCGPEAPCGRSLVAMERAHRQALEQLQKQHERQFHDLELERDRLLLEETQDTARVMEALKKKHREEMERELEKVKRLNSGGMDIQTFQAQQQAESQALQRELAGLSERYSQKCLELNRAKQSISEREREISRKERDLEQLRKDNKDLKVRLKEEISRIRLETADLNSEDKDRTFCELEVLLRVKENEIEYLHKEIGCLRNELQFLNTEKELAGERYTELHDELGRMRGQKEREVQSLKEHLKLAMAALQEGQKLGNSLEH